MRNLLSKLALAALVLAACGSLPTPAPSPTPPAPTPTLLPPTATSIPATATAIVIPATPEATATPASLFPPITDADWQIGPANARVTVVEYGDYQCPTCAQLAPILAQIRQEYPDDFRLVYRHFPLIDKHDKAQLAAEAAEAAGAQGKFWEMHDLLYAKFAEWAELPPTAFRPLLTLYAQQIGLEAGQFSADLDDGKFTKPIQAAYAAAMRIPLPGTPFLLYNGEVYQGPISHWAFATLIKLERLKGRQYTTLPPEIIDPFKQYFATLHTPKGDVGIELLAEKAPLTVNNFVFLAREGWFDGITFHIVKPGAPSNCWTYRGPGDFIPFVQTGDPSGTGFGGPGYLIPDEINPDLNFDAAGWVGMANSGPNTNGSQFFITLGAIPELNGTHTLFGKVASGLDLVSNLTPRDPCINLEAPPGDVIKSVTIEEK